MELNRIQKAKKTDTDPNVKKNNLPSDPTLDKYPDLTGFGPATQHFHFLESIFAKSNIFFITFSQNLTLSLISVLVFNIFLATFVIIILYTFNHAFL